MKMSALVRVESRKEMELKFRSNDLPVAAKSDWAMVRSEVARKVLSAARIGPGDEEERLKLLRSVEMEEESDLVDCQ